MQGAEKLYKEIKDRKLKISINIVPKTMTNDIPLFDTYFGFESCVEVKKVIIKLKFHIESNCCTERSLQ